MDWWMLAMVAYGGSLLVALVVAKYFFGNSGVDKVRHTYGAPVELFGWLAETLVNVAVWPWAYRNRRLLREVFHLYPADDDYNPQDLQPRVDQVLCSLATDMQDAFDAEEGFRKQRPQDKEMLAIAKADAVWAKKQFWSAHALARRNGYIVSTTYGDYLKNATSW